MQCRSRGNYIFSIILYSTWDNARLRYIYAFMQISLHQYCLVGQEGLTCLAAELSAVEV